MHKTTLLFCLYFLANSYWCQQNTLDYARRIVKQLCASEMDGRGYVNNGCTRAGVFILHEMKAIGLQPFKGTYAQDFPLKVNTFPSKCLVKHGFKRCAPGVDYLIHPSSPNYKGKLRLNVMSAEAILKYPFGKNPLAPQAITFIPKNGFPRDSLVLVRRKLEKLAKIEIPVVEFTREKLTWSVSNETFKFPYIHYYDTNTAVNLNEIRVNLKTAFYPKYEVSNYLGIVPSKNASDSLLIVCAHYDHLGRMGSKTLFPGGNDNASGVAMMLSLAREINSHPLQNHSVLFIAFAGEEIGLEGSQAFVNSNLVDLNKVSMVLNLDILGSGEEGITVVNGSVFPKYFNQLVELNKAIPAVPVVKSRGKAANSDHFPFSEKGVPALFVYTMGPNKNYHDIHDTYENLSFDRFEALHFLFVRFLNRF